VNLRQALAYALRTLADSCIEDASLEGEIILRHVLGINSAELYTNLDLNLAAKQERIFNRLLERRRQGEPSAYITGHREFYGLDFRVDRNVLIPRPETELLVELALKLANDNRITKIADVGTGCGAIAISLAINLLQATVYATDISPSALEVARDNCKSHGVQERVVFLHGDLLEPLDEPIDMIVANLPYVRAADLKASRTLGFEPELALNGGKDGLARIRSLCHQAVKKLSKSGCMLLETGEGQAETISDILRKAFPVASIEVYKDLAGIERVVSLCLT
jgi:release factor glutamine methyltransferase